MNFSHTPMTCRTGEARDASDNRHAHMARNGMNAYAPNGHREPADLRWARYARVSTVEQTRL
jgi:hypothetical protein